MAGHFSYQHLPAKGLGQLNPLRSTVAGGLGDGIGVIFPPFTEILEQRIYEDIERAMMAMDRSLLGSLGRELDLIGRDYVNASRFQNDAERIYDAIDRATNQIDRALAGGSRSMNSPDRDLR